MASINKKMYLSLKEKVADPKFRGGSFAVNQYIHGVGPEKKRKCTDKKYLVIFLLYLGVMAYIAKYAMDNGET